MKLGRFIPSIFFSPEDDLPPAGGNTPTPTPESEPRRSRSVNCGYCGCQLDPHGEVMKMGADAIKFRDQEDEIRKLRAKLSERDEEITRLKAPAAVAERKRGALADL